MFPTLFRRRPVGVGTHRGSLYQHVKVWLAIVVLASCTSSTSGDQTDRDSQVFEALPPTALPNTTLATSSVFPDAQVFGLVDATRAVVGLKLERWAETKPLHGGVVWVATIEAVDFIDTEYVTQIGVRGTLSAGQRLLIELEPAVARQPSIVSGGHRIAYLLRADDTVTSPAPDQVTWYAMGAIDRVTGEFLGMDGPDYNRVLRKLDPSMLSFDALLSWAKDASQLSASPTSKRLGDILIPQPKRLTWGETDPERRSLSISDIPNNRRQEFTTIGFAIEWTDAAPGSALLIRSSSGIVHGAGAGSPDHLAIGYTRPGDEIRLQVCPKEAQMDNCVTLAQLRLDDRPVFMVSVRGDKLRRFEAFAVTDDLVSLAPPSLRDQAKLYIDSGGLDVLGKSPPPGGSDGSGTPSS